MDLETDDVKQRCFEYEFITITQHRPRGCFNVVESSNYRVRNKSWQKVQITFTYYNRFNMYYLAWKAIHQCCYLEALIGEQSF